MSDLTDALDNSERFASDYDRGLDDRWLVDEIVVDAARKVANPDYEIALLAWVDSAEPDSSDWQRRIDAAVNAALGITEDTE